MGSKYFLGILSLIALVTWLGVLALPNNNLRLIACDVGQGDAVLATMGNTQVLTDGGPNNSVLDCLGRHMPFWDRKIELVILTHPEKDHFEGLIEVFRRYKVEKFIANSVDNSSQDYQVLEDLVRGQGVTVVNPVRGMQVVLGLIQLDILSQTDRVLTDSSLGGESNVLGVWSKKGGLNEFSIVTRLSLGEFDALLTGDIDPKTSDQIAQQVVNSGWGPIEYIKVPHHGSRNGMTKNLLTALGSNGQSASRRIAVISAGKSNSYGHPHKEILDMLDEFNIKIERTDVDGDIEVETNGKTYYLKTF